MTEIVVLLSIRGVLATVIAVFVSLSALALFASKKNGLTKAMAWERLVIAVFVAVLALTSFWDVCSSEEVRQRTLLLWIAVLLAWGVSSAILAWKGIKDA